MQARDSRDEAQAQPSPRLTAAFLEAHEAAQSAVAVLLGDAGPMISDADLDAFSVGMGVDGDGLAAPA